MREILHILMVEDNQADVDLIREALPETGPVSFRIESVSRLSEALARLKYESIDLVLLDFDLPDSQGLETFHKLSEATSRIPVIILTGNDDQEVAVLAVRDGAQDYVVKGQAGGGMLTRMVRYAVERKRAEDALSEKTTMLDNILRSAIDMAVATTDLDFRITYYNPMAEKLFGYSAAQVIGKTVQEIHTKEKVAPERFVDAIEQVRSKGEYCFFWEQKTDTGIRHIESRVAGIISQNDDLVGYSLFSRDITNRKRAEEALHKHRQWLEVTLHSIGDAVLATDAEGRITFLNPVAARLTGWTEEQALGRPAQEVFPIIQELTRE
jgi:PAS domain S-box-containing protein